MIAVSNNVLYDQRMQRIATSLSKRYQVTIVGVAKNLDYQLENIPFEVEYLELRKYSGPLFYMQLNWKLYFYLLGKKADIIYAVDDDTALACTWASKNTSAKLVFDSHEYFTEVPELQGKKWKKKIWLWIEKFIVKNADRRITVNQDLASLFELNLGKHFDVIRNMPVQMQEEKLVDNKKKIILYQGVVNQGRGIEQLLEAMKKLPEFHCVIAGKGDLFDKIEHKIYNENISNVELLGYVKPSKLKEITKNAWIGLNLLENFSLNYYYSLANKFFDYVQAGLPSINMNFPVYARLNKEYEVSLLLDTLRVVDIVDAIYKLQDDSLYNKLQDNCKKARSVWVWEKEETKLHKIIDW